MGNDISAWMKYRKVQITRIADFLFFFNLYKQGLSLKNLLQSQKIISALEKSIVLRMQISLLCNQYGLIMKLKQPTYS